MKEELSQKTLKQRTSLFARILLRLCIPLFLLGGVFAGVQVTNQVQVLNKLNQVESRYSLEKIKEVLAGELASPDTVPERASLVATLKKLTDLYHAQAIGIYDLGTDRPLVPPTASAWSETDRANLEESLKQQRYGRPYTVSLNREARTLTAYLPVASTGATKIYGVRVVFALVDFQQALIASRGSLLLIVVFVLIAGVMIGFGLSQSIVKPIGELNHATQEIVKGNLGQHLNIRTGDEIERLAHTFNQMSHALQQMKTRAEDANPLTQLPGNQGILHEVNKRILERQKFVFFHVDLDRFKLFNDHFGLAKGDQAIKATADVLKRAVKDKGMESDFIGHQGGDDFVVVTQPAHAKELGDYICTLFDREVRKALYPKEDLERGYTLQLDRRRAAETGEKIDRKFPLISISLAGISNLKKEIPDYFACMSKAVTAKKEAKDIEESCAIIKEDF